MNGAFGVALVVWLGSGSVLYLLMSDRTAALVALVPAAIALLLGRAWERTRDRQSQLELAFVRKEDLANLHEAAARGDVRAMTTLGSKAVEKGDLDSALVWFKKAAKAGDGNAMLLAGDIARDVGKTKSARKWYAKAADCYDDRVREIAERRLVEVDRA